MKATQVLMEEHGVIGHVLEAMEKAAKQLETGQMRPRFFIDAAEFIRGFADGCHHKKEEDVLFVAMTAHGIPQEGGPVGVMLAEHEQRRAFTRRMLEAARKLEAGDGSALEAVLANARGYIQLLRQHILKENNVLFPMADRIIPETEQKKISEEFERVEEEETGAGVHEKYEALAERLESEATG